MPAKLAAATAALLVALCAAAPASSPAIPAPRIETAITAGPADGSRIEDERPSFDFAATLDGEPLPAAAFHCSVDGAPATACASPYRVAELGEGTHSFSVYAEDAEHSSLDPSPATRTFTLVFADEECEALEDEDEGEVETGECDEEPGAARALPPEECLLRSARARVLADDEQNQVRLSIRYTAFSPADADVEYRLMGARGSLKLDGASRRFAENGVFRLSEHLGEAEAEKVRAARRFTVSIDFPGAPRYCHRYDTRRLTIRRSTHSRVVWLQSDPIFGTNP